MPADRDLIAEGRKLADLFTDHAVFSAAGKEDMRRLLRDLADALEAKHAQHAETLGYLEHAYEVIEAQRPPLGYIVLAKAPNRTEPDVADYANPSIGVYADVEQARDAQRQAEAATIGRAPAVYRDRMTCVIAELREVQP